MKLKHNNYHNIKDRHIKMCMCVFAYIYVCKKHGTSKKKGRRRGRERERRTWCVYKGLRNMANDTLH